MGWQHSPFRINQSPGNFSNSKQRRQVPRTNSIWVAMQKPGRSRRPSGPRTKRRPRRPKPLRPGELVGTGLRAPKALRPQGSEVVSLKATANEGPAAGGIGGLRLVSAVCIFLLLVFSLVHCLEASGDMSRTTPRRMTSLTSCGQLPCVER